MGFLKRSQKKEDAQSEQEQLEEQYERLFPKIGRDFVHKKDLERFLNNLMFIIDPTGLFTFDFLDDSEARQRALIYKKFLDEEFDGSIVFKDLINLDDDNES